MAEIKEFLKNKLINQYGEALALEIIDGYSKKRITSLRVNTLKSSMDEVTHTLEDMNIPYTIYASIPNAILLPNHSAKELYDTDLVKKGLIYFQSLSSMLPPLFLDPSETDVILDMAAAPGGKTTEIAALTKNKAQITACEVNKIRSERLKHNLTLQGATNVFVMNQDAKRLDDFFSFDKILLDAPCSGSGTLSIYDEKGLNSFSIDLVRNSSRLQEEMLKKALKVLKKGNTMVYSTCSILREENEDILNRVLKQMNAVIVPIEMEGLPLLPSSIPGTILVKPNEYYEGFFVAKILKK